MKISSKEAIALGIDPTKLGFPDDPKKGPKRKKTKRQLTFTPIPVGAIVLGIDPSSTACGLAWLQQTHASPRLTLFQLIKPNPRRSELARVDFIVDGVLRHISEQLQHIAIIEWANLARWHGGARSGSMAPVLTTQAAIREAIRRRVLQIEMYSSNTWTGGVKKGIRAREIGLRYPNYAEFRAKGGDPGLDVADAAGMAMWRMGR